MIVYLFIHIKNKLICMIIYKYVTIWKKSQYLPIFPMLVDPEMFVLLKGGYGGEGVVEGIDPSMALFLELNFLFPPWLTFQLICI